MKLLRRFIYGATACTFLTQSIMPAYAVLPVAEREAHVANPYASHRFMTETGGRANAGILTYVRHKGKIKIAVGERNDGKGWCSWGGIADPDDTSLAYTAYREAEQETGGDDEAIVAPHNRRLASKEEGRFHDFFSRVPGKDASESPILNLFRLYLWEGKHVPKRAFTERWARAKDGHSREYTAFKWLDLEKLLAGDAQGVQLMPEFETAVRTVGPDLLKALRGEASLRDWVNEYTVTPELEAEGFVPQYDTAARFSPEALELERRVQEYVDGFDIGRLFSQVHYSTPPQGAAPVSSGSSAARPLSMSEQHLAMALGPKFQDPRDAATAEEAMDRQRANFAALLEIQPFRKEGSGGVQFQDVSAQAILKGPELIDHEVAMAAQGYYTHYHGLQGQNLLLYTAWGLQRMFLQGLPTFQFVLRGHDLYFKDQPLTLQGLRDKSAAIGHTGFYHGLTNGQSMCANQVVGAGGETTTTTSNSLEYWAQGFSSQKGKEKEMTEEAAIVRGLPTQVAPYFSLWNQYLAYLGNKNGKNGGMLQLFVPRAGIDEMVQWGFHGEDGTLKTWSGLEAAVAASLEEMPAHMRTTPMKKSIEGGKSGSDYQLFSEGRIYLHPELMQRAAITGTWFYPPTAEEEQELLHALRRTIAMDMVDAIWDQASFFQGAVLGQNDVFPAYKTLGVADRIQPISEISADLYEIILKFGALDLFEQAPLAASVPQFMKDIVPIFLERRAEMNKFVVDGIRFIREFFDQHPGVTVLPQEAQRRIMATFGMFHAARYDDTITHGIVRSIIDPALFEALVQDILPASLTPLARLAYVNTFRFSVTERDAALKPMFEQNRVTQELIHYLDSPADKGNPLVYENMMAWVVDSKYENDPGIETLFYKLVERGVAIPKGLECMDKASFRMLIGRVQDRLLAEGHFQGGLIVKESRLGKALLSSWNNVGMAPPLHLLSAEDQEPFKQGLDAKFFQEKGKEWSLAWYTRLPYSHEDPSNVVFLTIWSHLAKIFKFQTWDAEKELGDGAKPRDLIALFRENPGLTFEQAFPLGYISQVDGPAMPIHFPDIPQEQLPAAMNLMKVLAQLPAVNGNARYFQGALNSLFYAGVPRTEIKHIKLLSPRGSLGFSLEDFGDYNRAPLTREEGRQVGQILGEMSEAGYSTQKVKDKLDSLFSSSADTSALYQNARVFIPALWAYPALQPMLRNNYLPYVAYFQRDAQILGIPLGELQELWRHKLKGRTWDTYANFLMHMRMLEESKVLWEAEQVRVSEVAADAAL